MKTAVLLLVVFLTAAALLTPAHAQKEFSKLPDLYKRGVEIALKQVNSHPGLQSHFLFFKTLEKSHIDAGFSVQYFYHHFLLKASRCPRGTADANHNKCAFRNDRPLIDCGICYKAYKEVIEEEPKPYIHCVHKPTLTAEMVTARTDHCNKMSYSSGSASILLVKSNQ